MKNSKTILTVSNLSVGYSSKKSPKTVLRELNLELKRGSLTCLLGPNGSGKSTLIRTLSKIQQPISGDVELLNKPLSEFDNKELARELSMVLTDRTSPGNLTAYALVSLGRFPYTSWMGNLSASDKSQIQWAMEVTDCIRHADTHIGELSDGERQKVMIARALAQDTPIIFLDEPTAHLDLPNRLEIFHLLGRLAKESEKAILLSSHELDSALHSADNLWLINQGSIVSGIPEDLVISGALENSFAKDRIFFDYDGGHFKRQITGQGRSAKIVGDNTLSRWVGRALERKGYRVTSEDNSALTIEIMGERKSPNLRIKNTETTYTTIEQLLTAIEE